MTTITKKRPDVNLDYEALENPEIKKDFEKFITGSQKAQIDNASTFFNDDFDVV